LLLSEMPPIKYSPFDHSMRRAFVQMLSEDLDAQRVNFPYWRSVSNEHSLSIGSALGEVENTAEKFAFTVDLSHFKPDEIKVNQSGNELAIEGSHEEKYDEHGTIKRSVVRKYILPEDVNLESLRSSLSDKGHLTIEASKKTAEAAEFRTIPITRE
ncbi:hypothetical protein PENTCL1PPCAC_14383, partial [Pristionchus entomophagus]